MFAYDLHWYTKEHVHLKLEKKTGVYLSWSTNLETLAIDRNK